MNLVKWFRKNNTKIMAVVVIVLMVGFIGGSSLTYLLRGSGGIHKAVAHYGHNKKITHYDRSIAGQELEILQSLRADEVLRSQDLRGMLLGELLFSQNRSSAAMLDMARQTIQRNRYRISDKQLGAMYRGRTAPSDIYWILLREEAAAAGIHIQTEDVGGLLGRIIPQLFDNESYARVMQTIVSRFNVPEGQILETFGKLLAVLQYAQIVCSMEDVTSAQAKHIASRESETLDAELVRLGASAFADKGQTPPEEAVLAHFNRYKANTPGDVNEGNPFGFGYKLPDRIQFDYVAVKLKDVEAIIKPPTQEETEQYYRQNREQAFSEQLPADPNNPNSPRTRVKSYAEVADTVMKQLRRQKIMTKAEQILQEVRNVADVDLQPTGPDDQEVTIEQRREKAGSYEKIAQDLAKKHGVAVHSGQTGLLNARNMQSDAHLGRMFLTGYGYNPVPLSQVLFSVKELGENATVLLSMPQAEMYMTIGPARDPMASMTPDLSDHIMLVVRVANARKAAAPESLEVAYSTRTIDLGDASQEKGKSFSVKEEVVKDVRNLAAWDTTRSRAEEFMALAIKEGWDRAVAQFNQVYGEQAKADPNDPNVFQLEQLAGLQRVSKGELQVLAAQVANNPAGRLFLNEARNEGQFVDRLYSLIPADAAAATQMPQIMEFKPNRSCYVLRNLSVQRLSREEYQKMKSMVVLREEYNQIQNLAIVHLNPENILKRMNFKFVKQADQPSEDKVAQKAGETS
jgi:hypothetical protein